MYYALGINYETGTIMSVKAKINKSDGQANIDKCRVTANTYYHFERS